MQHGLDIFLIRVRPLLRSYYVLRHCDTTHRNHSALKRPLLTVPSRAFLLLWLDQTAALLRLLDTHS
jgi:hypothetical protein